MQGKKKIANHEDIALKTTAQFFRDEIMPALNIEGKVEAVVYIMADKFLDSKEMEQLKEEIKMTRLGRMLYDDGAKMKLKEQVGKKVEKGYSVTEIADMLEEDKAVIEEIMKEL